MANRHPEQAATRLLLRQRRLALQFDVSRLDFDREIFFDTIQHFCTVTNSSLRDVAHSDLRDGLTLRVPAGHGIRYIVLHNEDARGPRRKRFTLAHEIGHIYLDHLEDGEQQEAEADAFAAQLLMPRILMEQLVHLWDGGMMAAHAADIFAVSPSAAELRLRSLAKSVDFSDEDFALLQRLGGLLPVPGEPLVTI